MFKKSKAANRAFTLVELLIVIIIIGILAGALMLYSGSATDKAQAVKIVSNLKNIKSAMLLYAAASGKPCPALAVGEIIDGGVPGSLDKYLGAQLPDGYFVTNNGTDTYIACNLGNCKPPLNDSGVWKKITEMKDSGIAADTEGEPRIYLAGEQKERR